jgi:hypothetical protein
VIKSYHSHWHVPLGIKEVEQYVIFKAAYELKTCIDAIYETSGINNKYDVETTRILNYCIENFMDNIYVVELNEKGTTNQLSTSLLHKEITLAAMESTNILQEEDDENINMEEEVYEEENEAIVPPKLGDVDEPPKDDSNTQNSIAIYEAPNTSYEGI